MSKVFNRNYHKEESMDHYHKLPNGSQTSSMLIKPNANSLEPLHSHLYQKVGKTLETDLAQSGENHTHVTALGESGAPKMKQSK